MTAKRHLIVNADDFGLCGSVNRGIIRAYDDGILRSASLMVRYPAAADAVRLATERKDFSLGLHLDFGEWICRDGQWAALYEVVAVDDVAQVETEARAQLQAFEQLTGRRPTHIDSHQHVHRRPELAKAMRSLADQLNVPLRHFGRARYCGAFYGQTSEGLPLPDLINIAALSQLIRSLPEGLTELCCHPGEGESLDLLSTMYRRERAIETDTLCSPSVREVIGSEGINLCSFSTCPE